MSTLVSPTGYPAQPAKRRGVTFGLVLIIIGAIILLKSLGAIAPFDVDLSFPVIMIAVGVIVGMRSRFRSPAWIILVLIGVANAIPEFRIGRMESDELAVAIAFILIGAYVMRRRRWQQNTEGTPMPWQNWQPGSPSYGSASSHISGESTTFNDDKARASSSASALEPPYMINAFALFAGRKEMITSKNFQGGRVSAIFGGTTLNLMNADSSASHIVLDVTAALGGVEITIPSHWELVNEVDAIFGGVEDARMMRTAPTESSKTLVIRGFCLMGGVEIKSY
jgi:hypothetical protein